MTTRETSTTYPINIGPRDDVKRRVSDRDGLLLPTARTRRSRALSSAFQVGILVVILVVVILLVVAVSLIVYFTTSNRSKSVQCLPGTTECRFSLVESIPTNSSLQHGNLSLPTHEAFLRLLNGAQSSIHTLQFYFTLNNSAVEAAKGIYGLEVLNAFINAKVERNVDVSIIYNAPTKWMPDADVKVMQQYGIEARPINFKSLFKAGILHTKMVIVDKKNFYVGSANMDWRSLSQVKELGILVEDCECLGQDADRVFQVVSSFLEKGVIDEDFDTSIDLAHPVQVSMMSEGSAQTASIGTAFVAGSPKMLLSEHRTTDIAALLSIIDDAEEYIDTSVMDFVPFMCFSEPHVWWGELEDAFKRAVVRGVRIRMMVSHWYHSDSAQRPFLRNLMSFDDMCMATSMCKGSLTIREFIVPPDPNIPLYPYSRVNHPKYLLSEKQLFISTSNWSMDYFYDTGGASLILTHENARDGLHAIFQRDWDSGYVGPVPSPVDEIESI